MTSWDTGYSQKQSGFGQASSTAEVGLANCKQSVRLPVKVTAVKFTPLLSASCLCPANGRKPSVCKATCPLQVAATAPLLPWQHCFTQLGFPPGQIPCWSGKCPVWLCWVQIWMHSPTSQRITRKKQPRHGLVRQEHMVSLMTKCILENRQVHEHRYNVPHLPQVWKKQPIARRPAGASSPAALESSTSDSWEILPFQNSLFGLNQNKNLISCEMEFREH